MTHVHVDADESLDPFDIAQAVVGPHWLIKAERIKYSERTFQLYPALHESAALFESTYIRMLGRMMRELRKYIESEITHGALGKAVGYRPLATPEQLAELRKIIENFHLAFVVGQIGPEYVSPADIQRLMDAGVLPQDLAFVWQPGAGELPPEAARRIEDAYNYGAMLGHDKPTRSDIEKMTLKDFHEGPPPSPDEAAIEGVTEPRKRKGRKPRLSAQETHAREWVQRSAAEHVKGLGNRVAADMTTIAIEADANMRRKFQRAIREELDINIERREAWRQAVSEIGHRTKDWSRDLHRIAATEKQKAMQEGYVAALVDREGDPDETYVAKQPNPDACPDCIRLHLEAGPGSNPRIFKLSELIQNGTNVGKKRASWQAVVGPVHPWCGCELIHVPAGWGFDDDGNMVPMKMKRSELLGYDLRKSRGPLLSYGGTVPERGVAIHVGDPVRRAIIEQVISESPPEIFDRNIGVTYITTDHPRVQNPLDEHDLAYWTGNEIRITPRLKNNRLADVIRHELGHSLNVYLLHQWGTVAQVKQWHAKLYRVSKEEGFVSKYAQHDGIENAAEITRLYLYDRRRLVLNYPRQFAVAHRAYKGIWERPSSEPAEREEAAHARS